MRARSAAKAVTSPEQATFDLGPPVPFPDARSPAARLMNAAAPLLEALERGQPLEARFIQQVMTEAFSGSDAEGAWLWKDAYEACEIAQLQYLRRHLPSMRRHAKSSADLLDAVAALSALTPTHTRRSEDSQRFQQFSTPLPLAFIAGLAADIRSTDSVLEPSAGTGQLAIFAEDAGGRLHLNEVADTRAGLLTLLFPQHVTTRHNAEHIHDLLDTDIRPTIILMNPPFSAALHVKGRARGTDFRHLRSALQRLAPGGRLVAITGAHLSPENQDYRAAFAELSQKNRLVFSAPIAGAVYQHQGTTAETRLSVFDRVAEPDADPRTVCCPIAATAQELLRLVTAYVPPRRAIAAPPAHPAQPSRPPFTPRPVRSEAPADDLLVPAPPRSAEITPLSYRIIEDTGSAAVPGEALYEPYEVETIRIDGARPHPTRLVQSAAMASVRPPKPVYRPLLPPGIVVDGILSDAQLQSVIYAGEAHSAHLPGRWKVDETLDGLTAAAADDPGSFAFRKGWFLGDGTGAGKGRQLAGILLDNWLQGRRRAVWISRSDKLIEDAQRDWTALGQDKRHIVPIGRFRQGAPIALKEGILFVTYATLRSPERQGKASRLSQIIAWLGRGFDGVILFDEAHAMANAAVTSSERGARKPSQQGQAGLRLQHALPEARVVYCSATGATTVENLAYAQRLGLWGSEEFPFPTRESFVAAIQQGGIAALEVVARDLKSLGLYASRSLSYEGVKVDMLEHHLTMDQIRIYDAYAGAFQVIHQNLNAALEAANITSPEGTLNRQAKAAARSAFESNKQRFFSHLITAMKMPTLIPAIEADLAADRSVIVQIVSTSEALMERRLATIPAGQWNDLHIDVTPREYVLSYLEHSFPTQLHELYSDEDGNLSSRPVFADGQPVVCKEAEALRDAMLHRIAALPPVQSALDQLIHHFGADHVAEITGRSRRIVRKEGPSGSKLVVQNRSASSNLSETRAFMDGKKFVLVFSDAGGTGRSYHADLDCMNQRLRVHYLLEAGWRADAAIQGLGRSNRTNQKQPPLFRPVATDVRGEKRFLSTIARRLDSLGAITRGQRQTGGQGLFRPEDNLESPYARTALRQFYIHLHRGKVDGCSFQRFCDMTGLELIDRDGTLREELPPISTFLNRVLALEIAVQNTLFEYFEGLLQAQVDSAIAAGTFDVGLETITAESLTITTRQKIATHPSTGAETTLLTITRKDRNRPLGVDEALELAKTHKAPLMINSSSGRAAIVLPAPSWTLDDGSVEQRVRLVRPLERESHPRAMLSASRWKPTNAATFRAAWADELTGIPEFSETRFHMVTGLLLPIWKRLPADQPRVYRFLTDSKERVIGRVVPAEQLSTIAPALTPVTPEEAHAALHDGRAVSLPEGLSIRPVTVMTTRRFELTGFDPDSVERLKACGLVAEIITWRLRLFVPTGSRTLDVLRQLIRSQTGLAAPCAAARDAEPAPHRGRVPLHPQEPNVDPS
jgi:hypothetical protein